MKSIETLKVLVNWLRKTQNKLPKFKSIMLKNNRNIVKEVLSSEIVIPQLCDFFAKKLKKL